MSTNKFNNPKVYQTYVGRWSQVVAKQFVNWLDVKPACNWLDVGAGTGMLTSVILEQASPEKVVGIDPSSDYIAYAKEHIINEHVEFLVNKVEDLRPSDAKFDVAVSGLVLNFTPSPEQTLKDMTALVKSGGMVASYVWDYSGGMQMMRHFWDAAAKIDPASMNYDSGKKFTFCNPDGLTQLFQAQGLVDIDTRAIDADAHFKNFDEYWQPFLAAQGSISEYLRSLDDETLEAMRVQIVSQLPIEADGTIKLINRAWGVKGFVP